jgi:hypothetical protein
MVSTSCCRLEFRDRHVKRLCFKDAGGECEPTYELRKRKRRCLLFLSKRLRPAFLNGRAVNLCRECIPGDRRSEDGATITAAGWELFRYRDLIFALCEKYEDCLLPPARVASCYVWSRITVSCGRAIGTKILLFLTDGALDQAASSTPATDVRCIKRPEFAA